MSKLKKSIKGTGRFFWNPEPPKGEKERKFGRIFAHAGGALPEGTVVLVFRNAKFSNIDLTKRYRGNVVSFEAKPSPGGTYTASKVSLEAK